MYLIVILIIAPLVTPLLLNAVRAIKARIIFIEACTCIHCGTVNIVNNDRAACQCRVASEMRAMKANGPVKTGRDIARAIIATLPSNSMDFIVEIKR